MRLKQILKKVCVISALSIAAGSIFYLANSASNAVKIKNNLILSHHVNHKNKHNISGKHIIIYLKPDFQSKKIQTLYDHLQLESIIPFYETDNWVKIGHDNAHGEGRCRSPHHVPARSARGTRAGSNR